MSHGKSERGGGARRGYRIIVVSSIVLGVLGGVVFLSRVFTEASKSGGTAASVPVSTAVGTECDQGGGFVMCERLGQCVDPWVTPCDETIDSSVIQRMRNVRDAVGGQFSYPEPGLIGWRTDVNNVFVQNEIEGLTMVSGDRPFESVSAMSESLKLQGFKEDLSNMADGPGGGNRGYQLGGNVCVMRFQATNLVLPSESPQAPPDDPLKYDMELSCGRFQ